MTTINKIENIDTDGIQLLAVVLIYHNDAIETDTYGHSTVQCTVQCTLNYASGTNAYI